MKKFIFEDEQEDLDILAEDDLDLVEDEENEEAEQVNEVRYIDPQNVDKYDKDEIEEVTTASGEKRYKRKTGAQAPAQKEEPSKEASKKVINTSKNFEKFSKDIQEKAMNIANNFSSAWDKTYAGRGGRQPQISISNSGRVTMELGYGYSNADASKARTFAKRLGLDPNDYNKLDIVATSSHNDDAFITKDGLSDEGKPLY